jgi:hypothetical protein
MPTNELRNPSRIGKQRVAVAQTSHYAYRILGIAPWCAQRVWSLQYRTTIGEKE